jgi:hypothetical protein
MLFNLSNIDLTLLKSQKNELVDIIYSNPESNLWGVVGLLDSITDQMEDVYVSKVTPTQVVKINSNPYN